MRVIDTVCLCILLLHNTMGGGLVQVVKVVVISYVLFHCEFGYFFFFVACHLWWRVSHRFPDVLLPYPWYYH